MTNTDSGTPRTDALRGRDYDASNASSVIQFLDEVIEEHEQLERENADLRRQLAEAVADIEKLSDEKRRMWERTITLENQLADERRRVVELADNVKVRGDALVGAIDPDLAAIGEHYIGLADEIFALADPQSAAGEKT